MPTMAASSTSVQITRLVIVGLVLCDLWPFLCDDFDSKFMFCCSFSVMVVDAHAGTKSKNMLRC
jgi:hypothetical protein